MKLNASHDLFVASDMVNAGLQDDGTPYISETFYVMLEDAHGNRYKHYHLFPATVVTKDEDGETLFISDKKQAEERAAQLLSHQEPWKDQHELLETRSSGVRFSSLYRVRTEQRSGAGGSRGLSSSSETPRAS